MRVLHIYRDLWQDGGVPSQVRQLAAAQSELGAEVYALSGVRSGGSAPTPGVRRVTLREARRLSPAAIHVHGALITADLVYSGLMPRSRTWFSPHGTLNPLGLDRQFGGGQHRGAKRWLKRAFIRGLVTPSIRRCVGVIAEAAYEGEVLEALGARKVAVAPMGIDAAWIQSGAPGATPLDTTEPRVTYLGRLDVYHKGLDVLVEALCLVRNETGIEPIVRLVGSDSGGSTRWLDQRVRELGLTNVAIEGPTWGDKKNRLFEETDWFWSVFRYAGMARACGEAVGRGIPLIASREGNWGDWVLRHGIGLTTALDVGSAAEALKKAYRLTPEQYATVREAVTRFARDFSWAKTAEETLAAYGA